MLPITISGKEQESEAAKSILSEMTLPSEIESIEIRSGLDSTGDPALWVILWVSKQFEFDADKAKLLNRAAEEVQIKLLEGNFSRFPYTTLDQAA